MAEPLAAGAAGQDHAQGQGSGCCSACAVRCRAGLICSRSGPDEAHVSDDVRFSLRYTGDDPIARELGEPPLPAPAATPPARAEWSDPGPGLACAPPGPAGPGRGRQGRTPDQAARLPGPRGPRGPSRAGRDRRGPGPLTSGQKPECAARTSRRPDRPGLSLPLRGTAAVVSAPQGQEVVVSRPLSDTTMSAGTTRQCQRSWEARPGGPKGQA